MRLEEAAELLEVSVDADETQIKASFRRLALLYHPDRCQDADATARFQKINQAYTIMVDGAADEDEDDDEDDDEYYSEDEDDDDEDYDYEESEEMPFFMGGFPGFGGSRGPEVVFMNGVPYFVQPGRNPGHGGGCRPGHCVHGFPNDEDFGHAHRRAQAEREERAREEAKRRQQAAQAQRARRAEEERKEEAERLKRERQAQGEARKKMEQARLAAEAARQARIDLFVAASKGDARAVKRLVEMEAVPYSGKEEGDTILHKCVSKGAKGAPERLQAAEFILRIDALRGFALDLRAPDGTGCNVFHLASQHGDVALAKVLLEARDKNPDDHKIDINGKSAFGWAPLHYAATSGSKEMVKLLIDNKARSFKGAGCTPLELIEQRLGDQLSAPARKNLEEIKALLEETYGPSASGKKSPSAPGAPKADKKKKDKKAAAASPEKASAASQAPKEQKQAEDPAEEARRQAAAAQAAAEKEQERLKKKAAQKEARLKEREAQRLAKEEEDRKQKIAEEEERKRREVAEEAERKRRAAEAMVERQRQAFQEVEDRRKREEAEKRRKQDQEAARSRQQEEEENRLRREKDELLRLERQKHQDYLRRQQQEEEEERRRRQGDDAERANMMSQVQGHLDKKRAALKMRQGEERDELMHAQAAVLEEIKIKILTAEAAQRRLEKLEEEEETMLLRKLEELHNRREKRKILMANHQNERAAQEALLAEQLSELEARHAKQEDDLAREMLEFQAQMMRWSSVSAPAPSPAPAPAPAPAPPAAPMKVYRTDPETGLPVRADGHHSPPAEEQLPLPSPPSNSKPKAKKAGVSPSAKSAGSPKVATGGAAQAENHSKKYVGICWNFHQPRGCFHGARCKYKHDPKDAETPAYKKLCEQMKAVVKGGSEAQEASKPAAEAAPEPWRAARYKTRPCRYFETKGRCDKGAECPFIHGEKDA